MSADRITNNKNAMLESLHLTWSDWLAIYAALVSTIVAVIKLVAFRRDTRIKLIVQLEFSLGRPRGLTVTIVNDSAFHVYVQNPGYSLLYVGRNGVVQESSLPIFSTRIDFPCRLERHESIAIFFIPERGKNLFGWNQDTKEWNPNEVPRELTEVRAWIHDTKGRKFRSQALKGSPAEWRSLGID